MSETLFEKIWNSHLVKEKENEASLSANFSIESRSGSKSELSTGNNPQKTTGWDGLYPGRALSHL